MTNKSSGDTIQIESEGMAKLKSIINKLERHGGDRVVEKRVVNSVGSSYRYEYEFALNSSIWRIIFYDSQNKTSGEQEVKGLFEVRNILNETRVGGELFENVTQALDWLGVTPMRFGVGDLVRIKETKSNIEKVGEERVGMIGLVRETIPNRKSYYIEWVTGDGDEGLEFNWYLTNGTHEGMLRKVK